jgi:hypothetical protein
MTQSHRRRAAVLSLLLTGLLASGAVPGVSQAATRSASGTTSTPQWLAVVNHYRFLAGLPSVTEKPALSVNDAKHALYMVKEHFLGHTEAPASPWYTPGGSDAAQHSNVMRGGYDTTQKAAVESWMTGPFHAIGILDPRLAQVGYGSYKEHTADPSFEFAAALDILNELTNVPGPGTFPVKFPSDGKTTYLSRYSGGESPDPLTSCAGYSVPTGPPIMLELAAVTPVTLSSFAQAGGPNLPYCIFDSSNYVNPNAATQSLARQVLAARSAIVIIPRAPLKSRKTYNVSVTAGTTTSWSFKVGDVTAPVTRITKPVYGADYPATDLRTFKGTSSADTTRVDVSLAQYTNGNCKFWNGSKWVARGCADRIWLRATGTDAWSYRTAAKLPSSVNASPIGNYLLWSRGRDKAGNIETRFDSPRNYSAFNISP